MERTRKAHKVYHKTNPNSLPNPFNWELRIRLLDQDGNFIEMVSQITAFRLMKGDAADLILVKEPTIQLKVSTEEWRAVAKGATQNNAKKWMGWLHARRTILYGNYHIQSPDGDLMFHCNNQKALWYLNRDLADIVVNDPPTLRLKFMPGGPGHVGDDYYLTPKINRCVVCGSIQGLNRHHVLPSLYRRYMGLDIKSHSYHDVLLLCLPCHEKYEASAGELKLAIAQEYGVPLHARYNLQTGQQAVVDKVQDRAIKAAVALVRNKEKIPLERRELLLSYIREAIGHDPTDDDVEEIAKKDCRFKKIAFKNGYIDHGEIVIRQLGTLEAIQEFAEKWRRHFLQVMQPQYLPANWDCSKPLLPEDFEPESGSLSLVHDRTQPNGGKPMGMVKAYLAEYCEAVHPDDYDAQDDLFEKICEGTVVVPMEEMQSVIGRYRAEKLKAEEKFPPQKNTAEGTLQ